MIRAADKSELGCSRTTFGSPNALQGKDMDKKNTNKIVLRNKILPGLTSTTPRVSGVSKDFKGLMHAEVVVGPSGGYYRFPTMGLEMVLPRDSLDKSVSLNISIHDVFEDLPISSKLGPLVRIEPDDVEYLKPLILILHNWQIPQQKPNQVVLHRKTRTSPWEVISTIPDETDGRHKLGFSVCKEKKALITPKSVIIATRSNCDQCFVDLHPGGVQNMGIIIFGDYQPISRILNIRMYLIHNTRERIEAVKEMEEMMRGQLLGTNTFSVNEIDPVILNLSALAFEQELNVTPPSRTIDNSTIQAEMRQSRGNAACESFMVRVHLPGEANSDIQSVNICAGVGNREVSLAADLSRFTQQSYGRRQAAENFQCSQLNPRYEEIVGVLCEELTTEDATKIANEGTITVDNEPNTDEEGIKRLIFSVFVVDNDVEQVLAKLRLFNIDQGKINNIQRSLT